MNSLITDNPQGTVSINCAALLQIIFKVSMTRQIQRKKCRGWQRRICGDDRQYEWAEIAYLKGIAVEKLRKEPRENQLMRTRQWLWSQTCTAKSNGKSWAGGRGVWKGTNTNSLALSTDEILKVSSSWEEGSWTWCYQRSVKEFEFLRENKMKVGTCSDLEAGRWGGEDSFMG